MDDASFLVCYYLTVYISGMPPFTPGDGCSRCPTGYLNCDSNGLCGTSQLAMYRITVMNHIVLHLCYVSYQDYDVASTGLITCLISFTHSLYSSLLPSLLPSFSPFLLPSLPPFLSLPLSLLPSLSHTLYTATSSLPPLVPDDSQPPTTIVRSKLSMNMCVLVLKNVSVLASDLWGN